MVSTGFVASSYATAAIILDASAIIHDLIVGSTADTEEGLLKILYKALQHLLSVLAEKKLVWNPKKSHFFVREVEFCGHILSEGQRRPAPGKLMPKNAGNYPRL